MHYISAIPQCQQLNNRRQVRRAYHICNMLKYVIKRLLLTIPVLLCVAFIVFTIMALTPGTPAENILGTNATQEAIDALNHEFGYDQPFLVRFFNYIKGIVLEGDFGTSYRSNKPVFTEIMGRFPKTLILALSSMVLSAVIGISLGILSAVKQYSFIDTVATLIAMFFAAVPSFWFSMILIFIFSLTLGWLPSMGADSFACYIMPTIALSLSGAASILRLTRTQMLETIRQDYIRTAEAKGAHQRTIVWKHALKNALLPVITALGMKLGELLGGAVIAETVFSMPGLGKYILNSILTKDDPAVMASAIFLAALFCLVMLIVDIIYAFIDPRIRAKYNS